MVFWHLTNPFARRLAFLMPSLVVSDLLVGDTPLMGE
jgi:hypothetical protein